MALLRASKKPPNCQRAARWVWSVGSMARLQICRFHMLVSYRPWIAVPLRGLGKPQQSKYLGPPWDQTKKTSRSTVLKRPPLFLKKSVISQRPNTWAAICGRCTLVIATWPPPKKNTPRWPEVSKLYGCNRPKSPISFLDEGVYFADPSLTSSTSWDERWWQGQ